MVRRILAAAVASLFLAVLLGVASPAGAVDNPQYTVPPPSTVVSTPTSVQSVQQPKKVETAVKVRPVRSKLAITGSDVGQTAALGGTLLAAGVVVLVLRRRATPA